MKLTIPVLPDSLSAALEKCATEQGKTIADVALEAIARGLATQLPYRQLRDLSSVAGSMSEEDASAIEETVRWMDEGDNSPPLPRV